MDWNDLRYILAVAEAGSLAGAARALGVNHTTVLRRVSALEKGLGLRLFERLPTGHVVTPGGEELVAAARAVRDTIVESERRVAGKDLRLSGTVRVTTTDTLMCSLLPDIIAGFRKAHPGILLEIAVSNAMFDLSRRDADVAIRPASEPPDILVGRLVAKAAFAVYAHRDYLVRRGKVADLADHCWIAPDDSLSATAAAQWMHSRLPHSEVALRVDSLVGAKLAAEAALGLAVLPCYLADTSDRLVRVQPPIKAVETALWILTHADLRRTERIRVFTEFAAKALGRRRALLEGRQPRAG